MSEAETISESCFLIVPSNPRGEWPKPSRRLGEPTLFECREIFGHALRRILQSRPLEPHGFEHRIGVLVPEARDELIGGNGFDVELTQNRRRKIAQVEGDDEPGPAVNRR